MWHDVLTFANALMSQHFLLSRPTKSLSLAQVFRTPDAEAETTFAKVRWPQPDGAPVCHRCGGLNAYDCRRLNGAPRFHCRACKADFSITSGTLFASHKLPLKAYLAAIVILLNEAKAAPALSRNLIRFPGNHLGLAIFGQQWKPVWLLIFSRSVARAAHRAEMILSRASREGMCLLTTGSSTSVHSVSAGCTSGV